MFHKILFHLGAKFRNPSLFKHYNELLKTDFAPVEDLKQIQLDKLNRLLSFAKKNAPYYQKVLANVDLPLKNLDEIKQIPAVDKTFLVQHNKEFLTIHNHKFDKVIYTETSGSSGQVLQFYRTEEWDSINRAAIMRGYHWHGVNMWDKNGYFWGYNFNKKKALKTKFMDILINRFRVFSYGDKELKAFVKKVQKATYLQGYSSMIYEVARIVNTWPEKMAFPKLKMVKGTSEKIYDHYKTEVEQAFGLPLISEYGAAECGTIAFECKEGRQMHINMEHVIVEEENGEAIITNLNSYSFPIIRYKLGDYIKLSDSSCSCGRQHKIVDDVLGRVGKRVQGKTKNYPSLTFYYVFKNLAFEYDYYLNYQCHQSEKGKLLVKIEQEKTDHLEKVLKVEFDKYFAEDIEVSYEWATTLHTKEGKLKDFISTIDV